MQGNGDIPRSVPAQCRIIAYNLNAQEIGEDTVHNQPAFVQNTAITRRFNMTLRRTPPESFGLLLMTALYATIRRAGARKPLESLLQASKAFHSPLFADKAAGIWMGYNGQMVRYDWSNDSFSRWDYPIKYMQYDFDFLQSV